MLYFNPKPNFLVIGKYYSFQEDLATLTKEYSDGIPIVIDWFDTEEKVEKINEAFRSVIEKFDLSNHYDDLLFLCLNKIQEIELIELELIFQSSQQARSKELAKLLLALQDHTHNGNSQIVIKTRKDTVKITDTKLNNWLTKSIVTAVGRGDLSVSDFDLRFKDATIKDSPDALNNEVLKEILSSPTINLKQQGTSLFVDFCLYLYPYLVNETAIKADKNVLFSDSQLNFYFELLELFGYLSRWNIQAENKDYMSSLLWNRIRALNPHRQGNKRRQKL